jgi:hypothetical protein
MPPAVLAAGIGAGGSLVSGILGNRAAGKARDAQMQANREALAYQREQDRRDQDIARRAWNAWNERRNLLLQRYGVSIPTLENPYGSASGAGANMGQPMMPGNSLADLLQRKRGY